jgi:hypothetical protein
MASQLSISSVIERFNLSWTLNSRINVTVDGSINEKKGSFVLYLPTVVLRAKHNPAFAIACRLANKYNVPLLILCVVLDDVHYPITRGCSIQKQQQHDTMDNLNNNPTTDLKSLSAVVGTSRRLAFTLQAIQAAAEEWTKNGSIIKIRVHGPNSRTPHHLTLSRQSIVCVSDEPFVHPYLNFTQTTEAACRRSNIPFIRVDGSTTVPPVSILKKTVDGSWTGVPGKAWRWEQMTNGKRKPHVYGAVKEKNFDAPHLSCQGEYAEKYLQQFYPKEWLDDSFDAPGQRAWTVNDLRTINIIDFSLQWPGIDNSVQPCTQTNGSLGWARWRTFVESGALASYAKRRNDISQPHAVSRLSCYLNLGTISIFQILYEMWELKCNTEKFDDEIVKWREIGYAHTFANPSTYFCEESIPKWACAWWNSQLEQYHKHGSSSSYILNDLANASSGGCLVWDSMQNYLNTTGELHNNARMTWGKTLLHWLLQSYQPVDVAMNEMAFLNDRYALDGISPPSYAGLLWCWGWCDKPSYNGGISMKPSSKYRKQATDFNNAQKVLLKNGHGINHDQARVNIVSTITSRPQPPLHDSSSMEHKREPNTSNLNSKSSKKSKSDKGNIMTYFAKTVG